MKKVLGVVLVWFGRLVLFISFWVWLTTLLAWEIFTNLTAAKLIYPSFFIMLFGLVFLLVGTHIIFKEMKE
ncbi:hypothetical protein [Lactococcus sp. DD01]|uniref:hypothetical protein n=1 Tax=Lactococcus sp. DD01 TaxID=1776443 RepID=UPI0007764C4B|nr:hypothetical protein [Lactococcus sp. DD01]KXT59624.1 hypothetical protein LACDD01_01969 [Lactococcus sp. DD01]